MDILNLIKFLHKFKKVYLNNCIVNMSFIRHDEIKEKYAERQS